MEISNLPMEIDRLNKNLSFSGLPKISEFTSQNLEEDIRMTIQCIETLYLCLKEENQKRQKIEEENKSISSSMNMLKVMLDSSKREIDSNLILIKELQYKNQNLESYGKESMFHLS